ncbi:MAG: hypothetical protein ISR34_10475 [Pirellulales bacterium]|nr:hypothetical protein [Pirellulales bacterium]
MSVIKILAPSVTLATADTVDSAKLVRVLNNKTSVQILTHTTGAGAVIGNMTLAAGEVVLIAKDPTDKLLGVATTLATKIAFKN